MGNQQTWTKEERLLALQMKRGLLRELLHHKQVTQVQFDRLMELQRGR